MILAMASAEFVLDGRVKVADDLPFAAIRAAISDQSVTEIILTFINNCALVEDSVLALRSLLLERRKGVILRSELYSNITNPDILLFLMGDIRLVKNPDIRIFLKKEDKNDYYKDTGASSNRRSVSRLLQQYLPVETLSKQWLTKKDLSDWGLIENSPVQLFLKELQEI